MTAVYVGIGSNVAPHAHVRLALELLERSFGVLDVSPIYRCAPVGFDGPDFLNLVVRFQVREALESVHAQLRDIEAACGRDRAVRQTSRTMDIDLLLFGDAIVDRDDLELPRPDILDHAFVLKPLSDLAPHARHPVREQSYRTLWAARASLDAGLVAVTLDRDAPLTLSE